MLTHLSIQGLAIVDSVHIDFNRGFNVITGETGAGKSILIKALGLLLGVKANPESVRKGFEHATVAGQFAIRDEHPALSLLKEWGIETEDDDFGAFIVIRRQITAKGRSQAWVNDIPVTTTSLRHLAESLIDVFGQHDNHRLLDVAFHNRYLDEFLRNKELPEKVERAWKDVADAISGLRSFVETVRTQGRDSDYLAFRLDELKEFEPSVLDYGKVQSLTEQSKQSQVVSSALQKANSALEDDEGTSLSARLRDVSRSLSATKISELVELAAEAQKIAESLDDLSFGLGKAAALVEVSEEDVDRAEERIAGYQSLFRKHNVQNPEDLVLEWDKLSKQVDAIEDASGHALKLLSEIRLKINILKSRARDLSLARKEAVGRIAKSVEKELFDLAMPGAKFSVALEDVVKPTQSLDLGFLGHDAEAKWAEVHDDWTTLSESGFERAQFYLASNAGEPSLPLARVASGGEVSRIMLALKKALAVGAETCVLVFDEIDTGISGRIADTVGQKIAELSDLCQIICISHLPQVAAYATKHYVVEKKVKGERTESNIRALDPEEHLDEIARLLSGNKVTDASRSHAENLVREARGKLGPKGSAPKAKLKPEAQAAAKKKIPAKSKEARTRR